MEMNVLPELLTVLEQNYQSKTAIPILIVISRLLTGDEVMIQYCLDLNVICHLKTMLNQTENNQIIKEILWCFSNIARGNHDQIFVFSIQ